MTHPRISFIVPVRNDAGRLDVCLRSIFSNVAATRLHEVIVVDNGSTDRSADVARRHGAQVLSIPDRIRVSELRNRATRAATGDILAFVDADHEIASGWTVAAMESLRLPSAGAVGALCLAPLDGTWVQRSYGLLRGRADGLQDVEWLGSGNLAIWRDAFESAGRFDESLEACEDVDLCQRLRARGLRVISDARLRNVHYGDPRTLGALFQSERWRGRDNVRVSLRRPVAWRAIPSALVPVVDIAMIGALLLGLLAMPAAFWPGLALVLLALVVMAGGTLARVVRAMVRDRAVRGLAAVQVLVVAGVYDLGRALALVRPAPHRTAHSSPAHSTS